MKQITEYELIDHGIEHEQYFQGCGLAFTDYDHVATGIGNNFAEALDDALDSIAQQDYETDGMEARVLADYFSGRKDYKGGPHVYNDDGEDDDCCDGMWYYLSIRVKGVACPTP